MLNFHYRNPARIFFGDGAENNMYDLLKEYKVTSLMFVYSGDFIKTLGIWDVIKDACDKLGIDFQECGDPRGRRCPRISSQGTPPAAGYG